MIDKHRGLGDPTVWERNNQKFCLPSSETKSPPDMPPWTANSMVCIPPKDPPITHFIDETSNSCFIRLSCNLTVSFTDISGKFFPYGAFVLGSIDCGFVEP